MHADSRQSKPNTIVLGTYVVVNPEYASVVVGVGTAHPHTRSQAVPRVVESAPTNGSHRVREDMYCLYFQACDALI